MHLHKRDVVDAATALLDAYGIADLTMRRLARELRVSPGALYWHFPNKQALLGAVADRILQRVDDAPGGWQDRITGTCRRLRDALLSYTDGAELVSASFAAGQSAAMRRIVAQLADAATEAGVAPDQAELAGCAPSCTTCWCSAPTNSRAIAVGRCRSGPARTVSRC